MIQLNTKPTRFLTRALLLMSVLWMPAAPAQDGVYEGHVVPRQVFELEFGVNGVVASVVDIGQRVAAGDEIAALDDTYYRAALAAREAEMSLAEARLEESARAFERDQVLYDEGSLSTVELDLRRIAHSEAVAAVEKARAAHLAARGQLRLGQIVAPVAGMVVRTDMGVGSNVLAGSDRSPTVTLHSDAAAIRVESGDTAVQPLAVGTAVRLSLDGQDSRGVVVEASGSEMTIHTDAPLPPVGTRVADIRPQ